MDKESLKNKEAPETATAFCGYAPPTSSTIYTPNQFFDVVLPNASRGCLRLVAYVIRKTLGWSDEHGNPQNPEAHVSYRELIECAGISRGALKPAIDEALSKRYIDCLRFGQPHRPGEEGFSALYSLRWNSSEDYVADPEKFDGFYSGNGNLTYIPNQFFDYTIRNESLAVVKLVGVIIRHTIGFQSKYGFRRQQVAMSFSEIMRRTSMGSRKTMHYALIEALSGNHIVKVTQGVFDAHNPSATVYAIKWADQPSDTPVRAVIEADFEDGSKRKPGNRFKKETKKSESVQKGNQPNGSEKKPGIGSEREPESVQDRNQEAFKKETSIKITNLKNTPKQQQHSLFEVGDAAAVPDELLSLRMLVKEGFDQEAAAMLARNHGYSLIERQVKAMKLRHSTTNRLGMLRRAIEENWPIPEGGVQTSEQSGEGASFAAHFYAALAGREGEPTVTPSQSEASQAADFFKRIVSKSLTPPNPDEQGRAFGRFVRRHQDQKGSPIRTLSIALRAFGDQFFAFFEEEKAKVERKALETARADHETTFTGDYQSFIEDFMRNAEANSPELIATFEEQTRKKILRLKQMSPRAAESYAERFEDPIERSALFIEFLTSEKLLTVPTFWQWDQTENETPFSPRSQSL